MKIAILADPLDNQSAGVHVYTSQLVKALIEYDTENEYVLIRQKKDPDLDIQQVVVPTIHWPIGYASLRMFVLIPIVLRRLGVDAVLEPAHFGPFNLPQRIKRITMIHDLTPILMPDFHRWHSQLLQRIFLKGILRRADLVLSNSQNTTKDIHQVFPFTQDKVATILLGRDSRFYPKATNNYLNKKAINASYFLSVGTIEPRKNLNLLLDAYEKFRDRGKEKIMLVVVGAKGWKSKAFFDRLARHSYQEDILLTGFVEQEDLVELYSAALALVYPSLYEGFGFPILEAMSCGTRVICSDSASLPEVGGDLALYFDGTKVDELTECLVKVYQTGSVKKSDQEALIARANTFSWERYVRSLEWVLKAVEY